VAGGVVAMKFFQQEFGILEGGVVNVTKKDEVSGNVVAVLQAGAFFGALGSAPISARFGRRWSLMAFSVIFLVGAVLQTVAEPAAGRGIAYIYAGRIISGLGVGAISAVAPAYVAECAPKDVRGRITGLFQVMVATGVMLSYFVNYGVSLHIAAGPDVWRIPFGIQILPAGMMCIGLLFTRESPRWLASVGRNEQALNDLAYLRRTTIDDSDVRDELAEIEAAIEEDQIARAGLGWREAIFGKGNGIRFVIAIGMFTLQQFSGQNSVGYYAPQIFQSIGYNGTTASLLASGIYGALKVIGTILFLIIGVERFGRKWSLVGSALGMGTLFYIIGALLATHPPDPNAESVSPASQGMAGLLYIYVVIYSFGWGPVPWIYVSDIFPTRTRHYGLSAASATQWLFNFVISKVTPLMVTALGWKLFILFATINIGGMFVFALFLPETMGKSLEEMDVIFGAVTAADRDADVAKHHRMHDGPEPQGSGSLDEKEKVQTIEKV